MDRSRRNPSALVFLGTCAIAASVASACQFAAQAEPADPVPATAIVAAAAKPAPADCAGSIRQVAQRVKPAVVQITSEQQAQVGQFNQPFTVPAGVGSGVIYDDQGHILTNAHVVDGARQ